MKNAWNEIIIIEILSVVIGSAIKKKTQVAERIE
jgi:hypothetical protein